MIFEDDETLQMYVEESNEHLSNIENDLLVIESAGADIDEDLVNNVFRAAHSIKGGAGFMGLTNIKELGHKLENILGMIRAKEMIPTPEIVNALLKGFDKLSELINNVAQSNEMDIDEHLVALTGITQASLPNEEKDSVENLVDVCYANGRKAFTVSEFDIVQNRKQGKFIYLIEYDLIHDIQRKEKTPMEVIATLQSSGIIIESKIDIGAVGELAVDVPNRIPFVVLYATIIEPNIAPTLVAVAPNQVIEVTEEMVKSAGEAQEAETVEPAAPAEASAEAEPPAALEPPPAEAASAPAEPAPTAPVPPPAPAAPEVQETKAAAASPPPPKPAPKAPPKPAPKKEEEHKPAVEAKPTSVQTSLRVNVSLLDTLMNLAGEMVLSRNQLVQAISANNERAMDVASQRIDLVTSELQEAIMKTRMQSINNVFSKFPRVVRDLARQLGKEVDLFVEGKEVELDKTIIEAINDPLTHLVRNSVDHGIETPDVRVQMNKNTTGKVHLRAYHEAGQVNIEIEDDGKGLDPDKLAATAIRKGLITEQQAASMNEKERHGLIFYPGFSTAEQITDVSGRGVGMDVVKTNLDKLGGILDIESTVGEGTVIRIKLPLTLAIVPSQIIEAGKERYAIPQVNLDELLRIPPAQVKDRIEKVGGAEVVRLRGKLLPLIELSELLGIPRTFINPLDGKEYEDRRQSVLDRRSLRRSAVPETEKKFSEAKVIQNKRDEKKDRRYHSSSAINIAVVSAGAFKYGLVVDRLRDSEEIVVKPLGRHLKSCTGYAGATIMGDGKVALILDVAGLAQMGQLTSMEGLDRMADAAREKEAEKARQDRASLLLFRNDPKEQFSVPISLVERIERVDAAEIEMVGGQKVIQYRGGSLPLIELSQVSKVKPISERKQIEVIVFRLAGKEVGLMATPPVDAVDVAISIDSSTLRQPGIIGSTIINKVTTLMVDIFEVARLVNPEWFSKEGNESVAQKTGRGLILFAEDSNFFRKQVRGFLEDDGYDVIEARDGLMAWEILQDRFNEIDIILTDLEMPNMDGFEFTSRVKNDDRFKHFTVIALTSLASDEDMAKGKSVGIDNYMIKLERDKLLACIDGYIGR